MRDPFTDPFCQNDDLGLAIPDSDHAVSVCLPTWRDVIGYEEGEDRVLDSMECGYPRFLAHPFVAELFIAAQQEFAKKDESALVFPSLAAAWRCADYVKAQTGISCRLESYGWGNLSVVLLNEEGYERAWKYWQHSGEIVSSRHAESALTDAPVDEDTVEKGKTALLAIRERISATHPGTAPDDVFLFSSGMGAISVLHRIATKAKPDLPTIQIEFPYLDSLKIQEQFTEKGAVDFSITDSGGIEEVSGFFEKGNDASAVFTEVPSNPLLRTANLTELAPLFRSRGIPFFVDDTVATSLNVNALSIADAVTTSLTKTFSGDGDVAAGAVILNPESPFYDLLKEELPYEESASPLFSRDAITLEINSRHFAERVAATNENGLTLVEFLQDHPRVEKVWHPTTQCRDFYDAIRKPDGGYGGLISIRLSDGEDGASRFYNALELSKGPSLGTNFSLVCPYTLLAHFNELDWAEKRGAEKNLIRIWAGLEDSDDLLERFEKALSA